MKGSSNIPANRHWTANPKVQDEVLEAVTRVILSGNFILGEEVERFESEFSIISGVQGCGVGSGTDAVTIALLAGGIGAGDEVLVPAFAPAGTITGVLGCGAMPVLVDVTNDFELDLRSAQEAISKRTRALISVHFFGRMDNMWGISAFAQAFNLWVVEDCAHAHGAMLWDPGAGTWRQAGTIGDGAAFSFYPTKNLGACGDAGFCGTRHVDLLPHLKRLRQYGWTRKDHSECLGRNTRLDEMQAGILRVGLKTLPQRNERRSAIAAIYHQLLSPWLPEGSVIPAKIDHERVRVFHQYVLQTGKRDRLLAHFRQRGIGFGVHYPALNLQPAFASFSRGRKLSTAETLANRVVSLPIYPDLSDVEVEIICEILNTFWRMPGEVQFSSASPSQS